MFNGRVFVELNQCLSNIFGEEKVNTLLFYIPTYPTGMWSFQIASKGNINPINADEKKIAAFVSKNELNYYNGQIHKAAFAMPNFVKKLLKKVAAINA